MDLGEAKMAELRPAQQNHLLRRRAAEARGKNGGKCEGSQRLSMTKVWVILQA
jgi:hypothetical protein